LEARLRARSLVLADISDGVLPCDLQNGREGAGQHSHAGDGWRATRPMRPIR
jgi:hypothetical protein